MAMRGSVLQPFCITIRRYDLTHNPVSKKESTDDHRGAHTVPNLKSNFPDPIFVRFSVAVDFRISECFLEMEGNT
jgi:hypothetical protein